MPSENTLKKASWRVALIFIAGLTQTVTAQGPTREALTRFTYTEYHMGEDARLVVYAPSQEIAKKACKAAFDRIAQLDAMMSDYRKDSELMKLCDAAGGPPVHVSPELFLVLKRSEEVSRLCGGVFDITVGPVVKLWRAARKTHKLPDPVELANARKLVGWQGVKLNSTELTVTFAKPGIRLDLGGIAKGYAADEALKVLKHQGLSKALVDIGDLAIGDAPPGKNGWTISVPDAGKDGKPLSMVLKNCALSSSGDTEQFVEIGGKHFSHVVDPRTGRALSGRVQATVIAPHGLESDPLSLCLTILNGSQRRRLLKHYPGCRGFVRHL